MSRAQRAIIIGGGIAGPALAIFLARAGIEAAIFEAYPRGEAAGSGLAIAPNGMRVLGALGLADEVIACGTPVEEFRFRNGGGRTLARYTSDSVKRFGFPTVGLRRPVLKTILHRAVEAEGIPMEYARQLVSIDQPEQGVVAHFADGSSADGDFLIGADGIHSAVRQSVLPQSPAPGFVGLIGIGGIIPTANVPALTSRDIQSLNFTYGRNGFFGYCGAGGQNVMWWSNLPRGAPLSREEMTGPPPESTVGDMLRLYGQYHTPIPDLIRAASAPVLLNIFDIQSLPAWHQGRVLLIGDSAHAVSPNAGQGASMALEDAMYLTKLFRDEPQNDYPGVFAAFERGRKPRVERIVAEGRRRGGDKQIVSPFQSAVREVILIVVMNLFGRHADDWLHRYRIELQPLPGH